MELDISLDTEKLITKAPNWNLSGDCELLEIMKRISENMDERANHTFNAMENLDLSVRRAELALETTNNSLRALHFGQQYVEYRIQEDDDECEAANQDNLPQVKSKKPQKCPDEILDEFLANNIKVFRENFEKVEIKIPDSDDEDGTVTTTCMYRAKNHYDKPLPYIIGTKEWNQHWHVGTIEDANEYSGDEESEEFSETSSSSDGNEAAREESYDSANVTNVSDWASSLSLNIDKTKNIQRKDSDGQPSFVSATAAKAATVNPLATVSNSSSNTSLTNTQSRHMQIGKQRHPHEHDLFAALRQSPPSDDIPTVSSSSTSSSNVLSRPPHMAQQFPQSAYSISSKPPTEVKVQHNLFDEDEYDDIMPSRNSQQTLPTDDKVSTPVNNQIKRKPVNLFDDNEFNSFLSEITDKAHARGEASSATTSDYKNQVENQKHTNPISKSKQPEHIPSNSSQLSAPAVNQVKRKPVNLFDDNDDDFDSFRSQITSKVPANVNNSNNTNTLSNKHTKHQNETTTTIPTKPLIDKDTSAQLTKNKVNMFDDNAIDTSNANTRLQNQKHMSIPVPTPRKDASTSQLPKKTANLFDDSPPPSPVPSIKQKSDESKGRLNAESLFAGNPDDDFLHSFGTINKQMMDTSKGAISKNFGIASNQPRVKGTISLFSDDDDDDELDINNIFSRKIEPSSILTKKSSAAISLFADDDDSDKDIFGNKKSENTKKKIIPKTLESRTMNSKMPLNAPIPSEANTSLVKQESPIKSLTVDLFAEEIRQTENEAKLPLVNASLIKQELPIKSLNVDLFDEDEIIQSESKLSDVKPQEDSSQLKKENQSDSGNSEINENVQILVENKTLTAKTEDYKLLDPADSDEDDDLFSNSKSNSKLIKPLKQIESGEIQNSKMEKPPIMNKTEKLHESKEDTPNGISSATNIFSDVKVPQDDEYDDDELFPTAIKSIRTNNEDTRIPDIVTIEDINDDDDEMITEMKDNYEEEHSMEINVQGLSDSLTNLVIENSPEIMRNAEDLDALSRPNQTYNSLFMDEPPDDSEFFQTLGSSKLSSSKIFDLDPDFYEPSLPDIPNTSKAAAEVTQAISSDYDGLRFFSEIPPDDDHESPKQTMQEAITRVETIGSGTKRLHTIFYDDFSETTTSSSLAKGNAIQNSAVPTIFNDEPPPDIESRSDRDVVDRSVDKTARDLEREAMPKRESVTVGKLLIPKININVQALLPSTGAIPKIRKTPGSQSQKSRATLLPTETNTSTVHIREQQTSRENASTSSNQNLLSCVNKMRVRVPVKRRPSTRRARQENYRKSLLDEAHVEHDDIDGKEIAPKERSTKKPTPAKTIIPKTKTFLDSDDDGDDEAAFFNPRKSLPAANNVKKPLEVTKAKPSVVTKAKEPPPPVVNFNPYAGMQSSSLANKTYKSFLDTDDDDDDDDLFAKIDNMPTKKPTEEINVPKNVQTTKSEEKPIEKNPGQKVKSSLFSSDDDDDNSEFLSSLKRRAPSKPKTPTAKGLFSDVDSDDGDDLFGGGGDSKRHATSKNQHSKQATGGKEESRSKIVKKPPPTTASDNPLADLLNP